MVLRLLPEEVGNCKSGHTLLSLGSTVEKSRIFDNPIGRSGGCQTTDAVFVSDQASNTPGTIATFLDVYYLLLFLPIN